MPANQLAVVTGASTGIGLELARCAAEDGFNLIIASDEPAMSKRQPISAGSVRLSRRSRPTCPRSMASTSSAPLSATVRSMLCLPMRVSDLAKPS